MRNHIRRANLAPAIAALALAISGAAHAATTTFTDKTTFQTGLTTTVLDTYENPAYASGLTNTQMSGVLGQTAYTGGGTNTIVPAIYSYPTGKEYCVSAAQKCDGALSFDLTGSSLATGGGVFAVGFDYRDTSNLYPSILYSTIEVTFSDGSKTSYVVRSDAITPTFPDTTPTHERFFGIQSDLGIKSISIPVVARPTESGSHNYGVAIDNLILGSNGSSAAVPEPATWAMMILGFFGVGGLARRKARALAV